MALTPAYFETDNVTGQEQKLVGAGGPLVSNSAWLANHAAEHAAINVGIQLPISGRRLKVALVGDSLTSVASRHYPRSDYLEASWSGNITATNIGTSYVPEAAPDNACVSGDAVSYTFDGTYMTVAIAGDTPGLPVDVSTSGFYHITSGTNGKGMTFKLQNMPAATPGTDTGTVSGVKQKFFGWFNSHWYAALARVGMRNFDIRNFGIAGDTPSMLYRRIWQVEDEEPDVVILLIGTNNVTDPASTIQCMDAMKAVAKLLICIPIPPRGDTSGVVEQQVMATNRMIWRHAMDIGAFFWDKFSVVSNPLGTTGTGVINTNYFHTDNLHLNVFGGITCGLNLYEKLLSKLFNGLTGGISSAIDTYDATHNPYGNRLGTIGAFIGTSGTLGGTPTPTGTLATGWVDALLAGSGYSTVVYTAPQDGSPVARTDELAGNWQRVVATTAASGGSSRSIQATASNVAAGGTYRARLTARLSAVTLLTNFSVYVEMTATASGTKRAYLGYWGYNQTGGTLADTGAMYLQSPDFVVPADVTSTKMIILYGNGTGGSMTLDIQDAVIEPVETVA